MRAIISSSSAGKIKNSTPPHPSFDGCGVVDLRIDGITEEQYTADVYMLDGVKNMELADSLPLSGMKKRLVLNVSEYGAVLIKLH